MEYISYLKIMQKINDLEKGDIVYVVSDILQLMVQANMHNEIFDINKFLDTIMEKIGSTGTLLIPTFNWDFCKGITFDYNSTSCKVGVLGKTALKNKKFVRTKHPIYSFAVWGKDADMLAKMDPEASFGIGTCFDYMEQNNAKALVIDLPAMKGLTFLHHVEQIVGVPFRYQKKFTANYIDKDGNCKEKTYSMYVRDLEMDAKECTEPFNCILEQLGVCRTSVINDIPFRVLVLREVFELIRIDIQYNDSRNLYCYKGQKCK